MVDQSRLQYDSVVIAAVIMVVVIPTIIRTPAMYVFIPLPMIGIPASLSRFVQLVVPPLPPM
jgi:hypothetical protein